MTETEDRDLEARFAELRSNDARQAPPFGSTLRRAPGRVLAVAWKWGALAAAAVVLVVGGLTFGRLGAPPRPAPPSSTLAGWRAPSEVLLDFPARSLFGPPMPIGASVIDRFIPQTSVFKGEGP